MKRCWKGVGARGPTDAAICNMMLTLKDKHETILTRGVTSAEYCRVSLQILQNREMLALLVHVYSITCSY